MMKISVGSSARTEFYRFVRSPYSALQALRRLKNATDSALFSLLIEKCFEFDHGFIDLTYAKLSRILGRGTRAIAAATRRLLKLGLVVVERLDDRSYRWRVPVNSDEIKSNPDGRYVVRDIEPAEGGGHDRSIISVMIDQGVSVMIDRSCPDGPIERAAKLDVARVEASIFDSKNVAPNNIFKNSLKNQHQSGPAEAVKSPLPLTGKSDDEPVLGKLLFQELLGVGMKSRMARKLLKTHEHELVKRVLERVAVRSDLKNPAGYIVCELEDGGYEAESLEIPTTSSAKVSREKTVAGHSGAALGLSAGSVSLSATQTKAESDRLEAEGLAKEARYREEFKTLRERFSGLSEGLRSQLRAFWNEHLERTLPSTRRKRAMMQEPTFQRMAFKEVTERFFALVDGGYDPDKALRHLAF